MEFSGQLHPRGVYGHSTHIGLFVLDPLFTFFRSRAVNSVPHLRVTGSLIDKS